MKYFIDDSGGYLGGSDDEPLSVNEVPYAPNDARQKWNGTEYSQITQVELAAEKDAQVEDEFGGGSTRALIETFIEVINDGSVAASTAEDVIAKAKVKWLNELNELSKL